MLNIRPYTKSDSKQVVNWLTDEKAFRLWCADRFKSFPLTAQEFDSIYRNGSPLLGFIAEDCGNVIGHLFMQQRENGICKFGLIIVDSTKRGHGYGGRMLEAAIEYAKTHLSAKKIILSVFEDNTSAYLCYKKLGFTENGNIVPIKIIGSHKDYIELEKVL